MPATGIFQQHDRGSLPMGLFSELKRRNVFRVAAAYIVVAWLIIQVGDIAADSLGFPDWFMPMLFVLIGLGFPLALVLSWAYEITPQGVKKAADVHPVESITRRTGRKLDFIIIGVLAVAVSLLLWDKFGDGPPAPIADSAAQGASIAVLPFVNMSADPEQEYFSDGLSEEILNLLAQLRELKVTGRTSSFSFKGKDTPIPEIGQMLGVAHVLEGSVRKSGDRLRITAQLVETGTGFHLWSETFDRDVQDIFVIQTEIAQAIANALRVSLAGPGEAAPVAHIAASIPAYEAFLQARRLIQGRTRAGIEAARALLDEALTLDPDYAPAHAAAAQAVLLLAALPTSYGDIPLAEAVAAAQPLLDRALALDPQLAEAHAVQGLLFLQQRDFARSETALDRALALNPSQSDALNWRANNLSTAGRLRERLAARRRLAELDPLNLANLANLALVLMQSGEPDEAAAVAQRIQRGFPDSPSGFFREAQGLAAAGRLAEARVPAARALALAPDNAIVQASVGSVYYVRGDFERVLTLPASRLHGPALLALGRIDEAVTAARERAAAAPGDIAAAYFLLQTLALAGRHAEVLAYYQERWDDLAGLEAGFGFDGVTAELAPIAAAQRALGQHEALAETVQRWGERLAFLREQGHADSWFRFIEASHQALAGERAAALAALAEAIGLGYRDPLLGLDPAFAALREDPAFQAQVVRNIDLINAERAQLGMEPLQ
jgi:TolB-like protein/Tfp pilus assembly protein PilF